MDDQFARMQELQQRIAELRARLPKHSAPASMMIELDELEEAFRTLKAALTDAQKEPREDDRQAP